MTDDAIRKVVRATLDEALGPIRKTFVELRDRMNAIEQRLGMYANDADLDGPRGNPTIRFAPKRFRGPGYIGKRYSEASPEFLDVLAEALQYSADHPKANDTDGKKAGWNRLDASRARAWARRIRSGVVPPPPEARALAGEPDPPFGSPEQEAFVPPNIEAPSFEAPSFDDFGPSDADEDTPTF
jgi:hypothetical protein